MTKKQKVLGILLTALRHKWEPTDNAHTVGILVDSWADSLIKVIEGGDNK